MSAVGDTRGWEDRFATLEERMLERIAAHWPICLAKFNGQPLEDAITINLQVALWNDPDVRSFCYWLQYHHEPKALAPDGLWYSKGEMDLVAFFDQDHHRYLAYECKRLNVTQSGGRHSLATPYVTEGVMRFVTEQYAEGLPFGCMLGYVLDGDVVFARQQIDGALSAHASANLSEGPSALPSQSGVARFRTRHVRNSGSDIELRHSLLA